MQEIMPHMFPIFLTLSIKVCAAELLIKLHLADKNQKQLQRTKEVFQTLQLEQLFPSPVQVSTKYSQKRGMGVAGSKEYLGSVQ